MVRIIAFLVAKSLAEESLMQAHELDILSVQGSSRTSRMAASTKQMEDQYKGMLMHVVESGSWDDPATGKPWVPNATGVLEPVRDIIQTMEDELKEQKDVNTFIMGNHTESVVVCNSKLASDLSGTVAPLHSAMSSSRDDHRTCRTQEDSAITSMESVCLRFDNLDKCNHEQNWFAALSEGKSGAGSLQQAIDFAVECKSQIGTTTTRAQACDAAQDKFVGAFCDYKTALDTACQDHQTCYDTNSDNWRMAESTIQKLEEEQKIIYRMLGRIRCYLKLLFRKAEGGSTPVQSDISDCEAATVTDEPLDITYGAVAARPECYLADGVKDEPVDPSPGDVAWYNKEFSKMTAHGKLNTEATCP